MTERAPIPDLVKEAREEDVSWADNGRARGVDTMAAHIRECEVCVDEGVMAATLDEGLPPGKLAAYIEGSHQAKRLDTPAIRGLFVQIRTATLWSSPRR
jgi:hypothetical protein